MRQMISYAQAGSFHLPEGLAIHEQIFVDEHPDYYRFEGDAQRLTGAQLMARFQAQQEAKAMTDSISTYLANRAKLIEANAYNPLDEHDACGVGLVASLDGKPRREIVEMGIKALKNVWHRGAVDADGKTGDGAGIRVEVPQDFFREHVTRTAATSRRTDPICVGQIFLPRTDFAAQEAATHDGRDRRCCTSASISMAGASRRSTYPSSARKRKTRAPRSSRSCSATPMGRSQRRAGACALYLPPPDRAPGPRSGDPELLYLLAEP
jgi:hypothetical protein